MKTFETLQFPAGVYEGLISLSVRAIVIALVLTMVFHIVGKIFDWKIKAKFLWYCHIPKIVISAIAIILIFCYDYEAKRPVMFHVNDMLFTTFLVGVLAIIELLTSFINILTDIISAAKECSRKPTWSDD